MKKIITLFVFAALLLFAVSCTGNAPDASQGTSSSDLGGADDTVVSIGTSSAVDSTVDTVPSTDVSTPDADTGETVPSVDSGDTVPSTDVSTPPADTDDEKDEAEGRGYFVASVTTTSPNLVSSPYTAHGEVPGELSGVYYSASAPGGDPTDKGGSIWIRLTPLRNYCVRDLTIEGTYGGYEVVDTDVYRIYGVESDLSVIATAKVLQNAGREIFEKYGYGITDDGKMVVSWKVSEDDPIRYVELTYTDSDGVDHKDFVDGDQGSAVLFEMTEGKLFLVDMRAIGYSGAGKRVQVTGCYMEAPKSVPFPRVEVTTEYLAWPSCDFVSSPDGCWGAGITNAFYEQCVVTVYDAGNRVVYSSASSAEAGAEYQGAKMKIRGNTSARYASNGRYPYKIKLDKKADLLYPLIGREDDGREYADKDWLLLNYGSDGYRICGDAVADAVGTEWSPEYCYVALYVNGEYRGLYVLSEAVEEGNGEGEEQWRVPVDEDGFVFECDAYWWNEDLYFSTPLTENTPMYFTFKYPDADKMDGSSPELLYLKAYLTEFERALMRNDDSYLDYIDLDSFVRWLLVSDYLSINDGGGCNLFLYKKDSTDGTKIVMGPNWDFDSYMGGVDALAVIRMTWDGAPFYYQYLIKKASFQERYCELFAETYGELEAYVEAAFDKIDLDAHNRLLSYDNKRFGTSTTSLTTRKERFLSFLANHIEWMKTQFSQ